MGVTNTSTRPDVWYVNVAPTLGTDTPLFSQVHVWPARYTFTTSTFMQPIKALYAYIFRLAGLVFFSWAATVNLCVRLCKARSEACLTFLTYLLTSVGIAPPPGCYTDSPSVRQMKGELDIRKNSFVLFHHISLGVPLIYMVMLPLHNLFHWGRF